MSKITKTVSHGGGQLFFEIKTKIVSQGGGQLKHRFGVPLLLLYPNAQTQPQIYFVYYHRTVNYVPTIGFPQGIQTHTAWFPYSEI